MTKCNNPELMICKDSCHIYEVGTPTITDRGEVKVYENTTKLKSITITCQGVEVER